MKSLWRIAPDTPDYVAHDLSGKGAEIPGGRWNRKGLPVVYAASTAALAALETIVHFAAAGLPLNRFLVRIDLPDDLWEARRSATPASLEVGWNAVPAGKVSLDVGDNDPARLWTYVATAVDRVREGLGRRALKRLRGTGGEHLPPSILLALNSSVWIAVPVGFVAPASSRGATFDWA